LPHGIGRGALRGADPAFLRSRPGGRRGPGRRGPAPGRRRGDVGGAAGGVAREPGLADPPGPRDTGTGRAKPPAAGCTGRCRTAPSRAIWGGAGVPGTPGRAGASPPGSVSNPTCEHLGTTAPIPVRAGIPVPPGRPDRTPEPM